MFRMVVEDKLINRSASVTGNGMVGLPVISSKWGIWIGSITKTYSLQGSSTLEFLIFFSSVKLIPGLNYEHAFFS